MTEPSDDQLILSHTDPLALAADWMKQAEKLEPNDPNAMALATSTPEGRPSVRMVLLKGFDERGFVFYSHLEGRKGRDLTANPHAALLFHWKSLRRQIRVEGSVSLVSDAEADAYFASRSRLSRIGAWASKQSEVMENRAEFVGRVASATARFVVGEVPRPPGWVGWRLAPEAIEFWQDMPFRLHDRLLYRSVPGGWTQERLYP